MRWSFTQVLLAGWVFIGSTGVTRQWCQHIVNIYLWALWGGPGSLAAKYFWCTIKSKSRQSCVSWPYKWEQMLSIEGGFPAGIYPGDILGDAFQSLLASLFLVILTTTWYDMAVSVWLACICRVKPDKFTSWYWLDTVTVIQMMMWNHGSIYSIKILFP